MNLCNNILHLGDFSVCENVHTGYIAAINGLYTVYFDYVGEIREYSVNLTIGEELIIPLNGLSEYYTYDLYAIDPNNNRIEIDSEGITYNAFRLKTTIVKSTEGEVTPPTTPTDPIYGEVLMHSQIFLCLNTTVDGSLASNQTVSATPVPGTEIEVLYNGREMDVGIGTKSGVTCYFSSDGGVTAKSTIAIGDRLYWNGSVAEFQLDTLDKLEISFLKPL